MILSFLCAALYAGPVSLDGNGRKSQKDGDERGIEFLSNEGICSFDLASEHQHTGCEIFFFRMGKKIKDIDMQFQKDGEVVGYLGNKHDADSFEPSEVEVLGQWFDQGKYFAGYDAYMPLKPFRVVEKFKGNLAVSTVPFYETEIARQYGDAYDLRPGDYTVVAKIITVDDVNYEHSWPLTIVYLNDTKGMFKTTTVTKGTAAKDNVIEAIPGTNAYKTEAYRLELIDALGRMLKYVEGSGKPLTIEEAGAYFLRAREKNGRVAGSKGVVKTH
jgi:hypothetical protein